MKKQVIITGANGNLGNAAVKKFLEEGYVVIAIDGKSDHLSFAFENPDFSFHSLDLTNEKAAGEFIRALIKNEQQIFAALMLVGGYADGDIAGTDGASVKKQIAVNFESAFYITQPLLQHMKENKNGRLIFIGSKPAIMPALAKTAVAYALAKSLLIRLAEMINEETKGTNVVATVVVPSTIDTVLNRQSMPGKNFADWVKPEALADVLEFICSEKGSVLREPLFKVYNNA